MGKFREFLTYHWKDIVTVALVTLAVLLAAKFVSYLLF